MLLSAKNLNFTFFIQFLKLSTFYSVKNYQPIFLTRKIFSEFGIFQKKLVFREFETKDKIKGSCISYPNWSESKIFIETDLGTKSTLIFCDKRNAMIMCHES